MLPFLSIVIPSGYSFALGSSDRTVVSATVVGAAPTGVAKVAASTKRQAIVVRIGPRQVAAELRRRKGDAHVQARAPSRDDVAQARRARNGARDAGSVVRPYDSAPEKRRIEVTVA